MNQVCPTDCKAVIHIQLETENSLFGTIDWRKRSRKKKEKKKAMKRKNGSISIDEIREGT
jgi:hypothetical protein